MSQQEKMKAITWRIARQMQDDFESGRQIVKHHGLRGKAAENSAVANFLRKYLPGTQIVRQNGEVVSSVGDVSTECDVLVCDPSIPPLWSENDVEVLPVECVHGLIEVKSI